MLEIIKDIPLIQDVKKYEVILVGTNIYGRLSNGFQFDVGEDYPFVKVTDVNTRYGDPKKMGTIVECQENDSPIFVLMYITKGYNFQPHKIKDYLDYESLENCLKLINIKYKGKTIATTIPGVFPWDGNGDKDKILEILNKTLTDVNVFVYDYKALSNREINSLKMHEKYKLILNKDKKGYKEFVKKLKNDCKERTARRPNFDNGKTN